MTALGGPGTRRGQSHFAGDGVSSDVSSRCEEALLGHICGHWRLSHGKSLQAPPGWGAQRASVRLVHRSEERGGLNFRTEVGRGVEIGPGA